MVREAGLAVFVKYGGKYARECIDFCDALLFYYNRKAICEAPEPKLIETTAKIWDPQQQELTTLTLKTKWRKGNLLYIIEIFPVDEQKYSDALKDSGKIWITFSDKDEFETMRIPIYYSAFVRQWDSEGNVTGLQKKDSVSCAYSDYKIIRSWGYEYSKDIFKKPTLEPKTTEDGPQ